MYRLSSDVDLSFLIGVQLLQVCIGKNEVILSFDRDVVITVLSKFAVGETESSARTYSEPTAAAIPLVGLLDHVVSHAEATHEGGLLLTFESGPMLNIFDDSEQYESFWIAHGEKEIIV